MSKKKPKEHIPRCNIRKTNLLYLSTLSKRREVSRSLALEEMIFYLFFLTEMNQDFFFHNKNGKKRSTYRGRKRNNFSRTPKLYLPRSYIEILLLEKERKGVSLTILIDSIFFIYRKKFPIKITQRSVYTPYKKKSK